MISRAEHLQILSKLLRSYPVVAIPGARQVKAPRVYLADTGVLHALLDIRTAKDLDNHP